MIGIGKDNMVDPLTPVRVKSLEEKNALLKAARDEWERIPGAHQHLVAASDEEYLGKISDNIVIESPALVRPRELSTAELDRQNGELVFAQIFGQRADDRDARTGNAAIDALWENTQQDEFAKLVGPARRQETLLESLVGKALDSVLRKTGRTLPMRESERPGLEIHPVMHAMGRDDSDAGRFVKAWIDNDKGTMREIARSLAAA
jgi:hypothetical protein